jgi:hypothetical protein
VEIWQSLFPNGHPHLDRALRNLAEIEIRESASGPD